MMTRTRQWIAKSRVVVASAIVLATMVVSLGVAVPSSSALSSSPFCKLMYTYKPSSPPTTMTTASYRAWAKANLPFFEKLVAAAPNATTKSELNSLVTILKYEESATSAKSLATYAAANSLKWADGGKALASAIIACAE